MSVTSRRALARCTFALVIGAALSGCSLNTDVSGPSVIVKITGDQQIAPVNTVLPTALGVTITTQFGERITNATVTWTIVSGGGSLSSTTTMTDDTGSAYVTYTTGPTAGQAIIRANAANGLAITFNETITSS
jgi:type V secretory pathway adhesin AidA